MQRINTNLLTISLCDCPINCLTNYNSNFTEIIFNTYFIKYNTQKDITTNITNITNQCLKLIPKSVNKIYFNYEFKGNICYIPSNVSKLSFYVWDKNLSEIPHTVSSVEIQKGFNLIVDNLGDNFNTLAFGNNFNQCVHNLPSKLEKLVLGINFNQNLNHLPSNLKILCLYAHLYPLESIINLPNLTYLELATNDDIKIKPNFIKCKYTEIYENNIISGKGINYPISTHIKKFYFHR